jgi:hypothetical protein
MTAESETGPAIRASACDDHLVRLPHALGRRRVGAAGARAGGISALALPFVALSRRENTPADTFDMAELALAKAVAE